MPLFTRKGLILGKLEVTSGVDSLPVVGTDAILARNLTLRPLVTETADRALLRGYLGSSEQIVVGERVEVEFEIEAASAGTSAITVPKYGPMMRASGTAQTIGASSVTYAPVSAAFSTATIYAYMDSVLHKLTGAVGNVRLVVNANDIPVYRYTFMGLYSAPTDSAPAAAVFTGYQTPQGIRDSAVPTLTIHGTVKTVHPIESFEADLGNALTYRGLMGSTACMITGREASGSVRLQAESVAAKDWWSIVRNATLGAVSLQIGTGAGNVVSFTAPRVQMIEPQYDDLDGVVMLSMGMRFIPNAGNDEVVFGTA